MNIAIILAAGQSQRAKQNKLWAQVHGQPLWTLAYKALYQHPQIHRVVLVVPEGQEDKFQNWIESHLQVDDKMWITTGGETRMDSFINGVEAIQKEIVLNEDVIVLDHNAANPNLTEQEITQSIQAAQKYGAVALSHPVVDTLMQVDSAGNYTQSLDRSKHRLMQTPQAARGDLVKKNVHKDALKATDLASLLLANQVPVHCLDAQPKNTKITFTEDIERVHASTYMGEDSHAFSQQGSLTLGGLTIPDLPAMHANSDGDVILHAIGRALAQALNTSFSEQADRLCEQGKKNSQSYLEPLLNELRKKGQKLSHVSLVIEAAKPRIDQLPVKESLAKILQVGLEKIRISAHTGDALTPFGKGEGIRCLALIQIVNG